MSDADYEKQLDDASELANEIFLKLDGQHVFTSIGALTAILSQLYKNHLCSPEYEPEVFSNDIKLNILLDLQEDE